MKRLLYAAGVAAVSVALATGAAAQQLSHNHADPAAKDHIQDRAPLLEHIGNLHHKVSTADPLAQRYFDQGLTMAYAFNHMESERSFRSAAAQDPKLAMAWWGVALALGPNINDNITPEREAKALEAIQQAVKLKANASPEERDLIDALAKRYGAKDKSERPEFDQAYYDSMKALATKYPDDPDVGALYAEATLDLSPWDYYNEKGEPTPAVAAAIVELERVMKRWPGHPGANHIYIHAVEASPHPERAVGASERLGPFAPAAGHLVHMPSHIWVRVGRWSDAAVSNENASKADEDYLAQCHAQGIYPLGYYPHNLHMLTYAAMMTGESARALESAKKAASRMPKEMMEDPPPFAEMFVSQPFNAMVRFGRWDDILAYPKPVEPKGFLLGLWHYARVVALVRKNQLPEAAAELVELQALAAMPSLKEYKVGTNDAAMLLSIAEGIASGELLAARGKNNEAVAALQRAVDVEDKLHYNEPEDWLYPARHSLGNLLLKLRRADKAESVFRADLKDHPANGWSLFGLEQALRAQKKNAEADAVAKELEAAWKNADVKLTAAVF